MLEFVQVGRANSSMVRSSVLADGLFARLGNDRPFEIDPEPINMYGL